MTLTLAHPDPDDDSGLFGDLQLSPDGNLVVYEGADSVQQRVVEALRYWRGEWFQDVEGGVPYFERVFRRPALVGFISVELTERILSVEGVTDVLNVVVEIEPRTRVLSWIAQYRDRDGRVHSMEASV